MPHYMDDEEDSFPMMAKRKMMKAMKAKRSTDMEEEDSPEMEKEMSLVKVEINVGGSNGKGKK
jgi:hypothetical protein